MRVVEPYARAWDLSNKIRFAAQFADTWGNYAFRAEEAVARLQGLGFSKNDSCEKLFAFVEEGVFREAGSGRFRVAPGWLQICHRQSLSRSGTGSAAAVKSLAETLLPALRELEKEIENLNKFPAV